MLSVYELYKIVGASEHTTLKQRHPVMVKT